MQKIILLIFIGTALILAAIAAIAEDESMESQNNPHGSIYPNLSEGILMQKKGPLEQNPPYVACQENSMKNPGETDDEYKKRMQSHREACQMAHEPREENSIPQYR